MKEINKEGNVTVEGADDRPSFVSVLGATVWTNARGNMHRDDGPCILWPHGDATWKINGKLVHSPREHP
jgi:hypothetical protein